MTGEVKQFAQRSADAVREIKALIENSVHKVDTGSTQVTMADESMDEIVKAVTRVAGIMGGIATTSDEQSRGIAQVTQAVTEMDRVTQQTPPWSQNRLPLPVNLKTRQLT